MPPHFVENIGQRLDALEQWKNYTVDPRRKWGRERWCLAYPDVPQKDMDQQGIPFSAMRSILPTLPNLPLLKKHDASTAPLGKLTRGRITSSGLEVGFRLETTPGCRAVRENVAVKLDSGASDEYGEVSLSHTAVYTNPPEYGVNEMSLCPKGGRSGAVVMTCASYKGSICSLVQTTPIPLSTKQQGGACENMTEVSGTTSTQSPPPSQEATSVGQNTGAPKSDQTGASDASSSAAAATAATAAAATDAAGAEKFDENAAVALMHKLEGQGVPDDTLMEVVQMLGAKLKEQQQEGDDKAEDTQQTQDAEATETSDGGSVVDKDMQELLALRARVTQKPRKDLFSFVESRLGHLEEKDRKRMSKLWGDVEANMLRDPNWRTLLSEMNESPHAGSGMQLPGPGSGSNKRKKPPASSSPTSSAKSEAAQPRGSDYWRDDLRRVLGKHKSNAVSGSGNKGISSSPTEGGGGPAQKKMRRSHGIPASMMTGGIGGMFRSTSQMNPTVRMVNASDDRDPPANELEAKSRSYWDRMNRSGPVTDAMLSRAIGRKLTRVTFDTFAKMTSK